MGPIEATLKKFGYPDTLIRDYRHWKILARPPQVTLGSLIVIENEGHKNFSRISDESFREYSAVIRDIEKVLGRLFHYDKMNYLMLMMVDPEVHFHVIPRYSKEISFADFTWKDFGWPKLPDLNQVNAVPKEKFQTLIDELRRNFK